MSLISDTDFLIHSLRLSYLRDVDDPYGPRIISLDPSYQSNPYILSASMTDVDRWPQLAMPSSPNLSEDEQDRPLGFPGARLKHTQTIMGGRTGGLGLRVHGKRASTSKRMSVSSRQLDMKNFVSDNAPVQQETAPAEKVLAQSAPGSESWVKTGAKGSSSSSPEPTVEVQQATAPEENPVARVVQFIPKFKGAAEMEARRRVRMEARRRPGAPVAQPPPKLDFSSSEDEAPVHEPSPDDSVVVVDSMDEGDEFDPVFAATRTGATSDSASDAMSIFSAGTATSSIAVSSSQTLNRPRPRLSPVSEHTGRAPRAPKPDDGARKRPDAPARSRGDSSTSTTSTHAHSPSLTQPPPSPEKLFVRRKVPPLRPLTSSLSALLASSGSSSNPFAEMYATISGRGESAATNVQIYFPHARQPHGKAMDLNVRRDATVEEVIGFALWSYWEKGWLPKLDEGLAGEDDPKRATRLSAVGWILRIAEDDGEVDDDFPPPDRMEKVTKFSEAYAILEATPTQIQQNQILEGKIQRRPSRTIAKKSVDKLNLPHPALSATAPTGAIYGSNFVTGGLSTSLGPSSSHGPQIFLRIHTADAVHISTTIPVSAGMYMQEALELVCRRRKLPNPNEYALLLADQSIILPLDRTVASLEGKRELLLVKRNMLPQMDVVMPKGIGKTTDPNASIFKRMSDTPEQQSSSVLDYTSAYKKYTIYRKMPMLVARQERTLAIDGDYIHIMPSTNKARAVFDNGKTSSYHIKSIADCQQSAKTSSIFKLILNRTAGNKRYDFEAESPRLAAEIVQAIKNLKAALDRSGTVNKSRRSRQVV
ncbi:stress-activated map kinase interacting protein 1-domain-containing protein [Pholiota molesta]|nr:stress-activated map kinase interacting protein 1-domain-containing protein [Pholiota molesta]